MIVSAFSGVPASRLRCTICPSVAAGIKRMVSGTKVPSPRTSRSIGPRFTVSVHTVALSTLGAAGFNRESAYVTSGIRTTAIAI